MDNLKFVIAMPDLQTKSANAIVNQMKSISGYSFNGALHTNTIIDLEELVFSDRRIEELIRIASTKKCKQLLSISFNGSPVEHNKYYQLSWELRSQDPKYQAYCSREASIEDLPLPVAYYGDRSIFLSFSHHFGENVYLCECEKAAYNSLTEDQLSAYRDRDPGIKYITGTVQFLPKLCFRCNNVLPSRSYCHEMYGSRFIQAYGWYVNLRIIEKGYNLLEGGPLPYENIFLDAENEIRAEFGYKPVGESWTSETLLYHLLQKMFPDDTVIFHHRPPWLNGLELDIYIPEKKLGFEYQGIQHYKPVQHWGGEEKLQIQRTHDREKKRICHQLGVALIEVRYNEKISEDAIMRKIRNQASHHADQGDMEVNHAQSKKAASQAAQ